MPRPIPVVNTTNNTIFVGTGVGFKTGDQITYKAGTGGAIGGLQDGSNYYVHVLEGGQVQLYDTAADAMNGTSTGLMHLTSTGGSTSAKLTRAQIAGIPSFLLGSDITFDPSTSVQVFALGQAAALHDGDAVVYSAGGGTPMGGLTDGQTYFVIEVGNGNYQLAATRADALAGNAIALSGNGNTNQRLLATGDSFRAAATSGPGVARSASPGRSRSTSSTPTPTRRSATLVPPRSPSPAAATPR